MEEAWKKAGIIFGIGAVVFSISLILSLQFYYMEEDPYAESYYPPDYYYDDDPVSMTWAEACGEYGGDSTCHELEQEKYSLIGGGLLCAGLAVVCFAKHEEEYREMASRGLDNLQTQQSENKQPAPITIEIKKN